MKTFQDFLNSIDGIVWGPLLIILIISVGIWLTIRTKLLQVIHLPKAFKFMVKDESDGVGEVSSFGALCTALSATIGTGNIVGVALAISGGGPGALFWMWIAAFFGMATKYAEGLLAVKYRVVTPEGRMLGGPFYYIQNGMGKKWTWLAKLFAFLGVCAGLLGIGTLTQVQSMTDAIEGFFDKNRENIAFSLYDTTTEGVTEPVNFTWAVVIGGIVITICAALVIIGGIKRISSVSSIVVPFMAIIYVVFCLVVICCNIKEIPAAFSDIFLGAFGVKQFVFGSFGAVVANAIQLGVSRGIFSNESGLGSAPIAAAAAKTKEPVRQGLVSMTGTFIDTLVICTLTGLTIITTGACGTYPVKNGIAGIDITTKAFTDGTSGFLPDGAASFTLMICLFFFAFTTVLGWNYYSEKCLEYLTGGKKWATQVFRWLYIACVFIGPYLTLEAVWTIANIFNGLMAFPNLIALLALSGVVAKETKSYFDRQKPGGAIKAKKAK